MSFLNLISAKPFASVYATPEVFIPELWANEALAILEEEMVAAQLCYRNYETSLASFGDTVNIQLPAELEANRKSRTGNVVVQTPTASNIDVKLDQHVECTFSLYDADISKSFIDLVNLYLRPALVANARHIDRIVLGQYPQFLTNQIGSMGNIASTNVVSRILGANKFMSINKAPMQNRNLLWTPTSESAVLSNELFISAEKVGDDGTALREASLGRKLNFSHWMSQNVPSVAGAVDEVTGAVDNAGGYLAGTTTIDVDGLSGAIANNTFLKIAGAGVHRVVSTAGGATPSSITLNSGLNAAVADNAVITISDPGAVDEAAGYAAGYDGPITFDGLTNKPVVGQMVSFGTSPTSALYSVIKATSTTILLDRPLVSSIADDDLLHVGPNGEYNIAMVPGAVALVVRPLVQPPSGVQSAVLSFNGLSVRVSISWDSSSLSHKVTVDMLCGVKTVRSELGGLVFG